jgi:predicted Zn-dependent protease
MSRAGHLREAIGAYEAAVSLSPREWGLRLELAELLVKVGARDRAVEQYRRILAGRPGHEGAQLGLARLAAVATDGG